MGVSTTEFESFEQQFLELVGEFQSITTSEGRLRESLRSESSRAEAAEAARAAAERSAAEARAAAAAAAAGATQATAALARAHDELTAVKMQAELAVRQRSLLDERCSELSTQLAVCEREVQQLRPLQASHATMQRQYQELQDRIRAATDVAKTEASRLEGELRRVERCAGGGAEVRERARLAASAHARERRLAAAELQHTTRELTAANAEIARLNVLITDLQRNSGYSEYSAKAKNVCNTDAEALAEARAALETERAGAARLEQALAVALKDNAALAAQIHAEDVAPASGQPPSPLEDRSVNISALDSFLAD